MGTRHLIAAVDGGKFVLAQYGQWDGYPEGQGVDVLRFLRGGDVPALRANLENGYEPTEDEYRRWYAEVGHDIDASNGFIAYDKSRKFNELHPTLSRDAGSDILDLVAKAAPSEPIPLKSAVAFAGDSLFCEWGYVIDFDSESFEVYRGFNKQPTRGDARFPSGAEWLEKRDGYEPIALAASFSLSDLPSDADFLAKFSNSEKARVLAGASERYRRLSGAPLDKVQPWTSEHDREHQALLAAVNACAHAVYDNTARLRVDTPWEQRLASVEPGIAAKYTEALTALIEFRVAMVVEGRADIGEYGRFIPDGPRLCAERLPGYLEEIRRYQAKFGSRRTAA